MNNMLHVSSSPHVRDRVTTKNLMYDVVIALIPATVWGAYQFGIYALAVVIATVLACLVSEYVWEKGMGKPITITDGSAVVTGMILALNMPPEIPIWIPMLGGVFELIARAGIVLLVAGHTSFVGVCLSDPAAWLSALIPLVPYYIYIMKKWKTA